MAVVKPFCAVRPQESLASKIAALPYDVYNRKEAKEETEKNPYSFLKIDRPETQFPDDTDMYAPEVYKQARRIFWKMMEDGDFLQDVDPNFYLYELTRNGHVQTGIVACASIDDYLNGVIKKHENTRVEKELDRIRHVDVLEAQTGPIFLAYRANADFKHLMDVKKKDFPIFDFISEDGIRHRGWMIYESAMIHKIEKTFQAMDSIYIADGHHRAASAIKAGLKRRRENPNYTGREPFNYFLCTLFADEELEILDYNRVVKDLNGYSAEEFLEKIKERFTVSEPGTEAVSPREKGEFGMYLEDRWYKLKIKEEYRATDVVDGLDVALLQNNLLEPVLGIREPAKDPRIDFIGGIRGLGELEKRVQTDCKAAFSMYPTSMAELFAVADAGKLMPPKSTWFEPKLRSGLFIHRI